MSEPVIHVRGLSKVYRVYDRPADRFWELLLRRRKHHEFAALAEVDFQVEKGESLAIIGENGAGKSTLLKVLAGITHPTTGQVAVDGRIASILELGSGFHPEMTGRDNIVLNAAMLGLSQARLAERLDDIIAFSELGDFIEQPVKCYSSGMSMRLGFAIATQVDPEILIIDEALAVGDGYFQKKCMDRLVELVGDGTTLLFCSHSMYYVTAFCQRALWMREGRVEQVGPAAEVVQEYEAFLQAKRATVEPKTGSEEVPEGEPAARIVAVRQPHGERYDPQAPWAVEVEWEALDERTEFHLGVGINRSDGVEVSAFGTHLDALAPMAGQRRYRARLEIPELPLVKGEFGLDVYLLDEEGLHIYDRLLLPDCLRVRGSGYRLALVSMPHRWDLSQTGESTPSLEPVPSRWDLMASAD